MQEPLKAIQSPNLAEIILHLLYVTITPPDSFPQGELIPYIGTDLLLYMGVSMSISPS